MEYTKEQLDRIDRLVAEKVMGWKRTPVGDWDDKDGDRYVAGEFSPTRNWNDAGQVFERCSDMRLEHFKAYVAFDGAGGRDPIGDSYTCFALTPMLAICLRALASHGIDGVAG